ncbi:hypothetical protein HAX54_042893 [Datura stramonium]|uniref:GDSL esterase/lipase n=1 Tax=Datura stramonium TaxID=4076 RepID=A0ABS8W072_DATST|nr:hypothetical protein [Datura stramonium]
MVLVSSAGSGYDDLTANLSNVMSLAKQREYLRHYEIHLRQMVGVEKARETMKNAVYIISMGTNDFLQNYFVEPARSKQYSVEQYQNFLIRSMFTHVKIIHGQTGARRYAVVEFLLLGANHC